VDDHLRQGAQAEHISADQHTLEKQRFALMKHGARAGFVSEEQRAMERLHAEHCIVWRTLEHIDAAKLAQPSTQITNFWIIGGDYAGENIDKRQGEVFVDGSVISENVIGASPDVPTEQASGRDS
jgi:hypothetical protein